eukprot:CAMPEP_0183299714 /NCGR_PEP_ID=MMETSP0160_2-20130417/6372_1 /TAXON_ID=2839 ORGANISM="Odontella Sinensis, Strain Grunow 1884" /NCGR_SAMPLE_ID=MMETSP0160_2 /ASSEMBLY_ACC=CAM_ASM_000250 /LENGTH=258 /DNA_ID=CAMNT_0025462011 /DNA_START=62 /DNA_END=838 /DNA_ORIENTATION=-
MMSFTLMKIGDGWSASRSVLPPLMDCAGVPLDTWRSTFDSAISFQRECSPIVERLSSIQMGLAWSALCAFLSLMAFFPALDTDNYSLIIATLSALVGFALVVPVSAARVAKGLKKEMAAQVLSWNRFAEEQQVVYHGYGIKVVMIKIVTGLTPKIIVGGLKFSQTSPSTDAPPQERKSLIDELKALHQLHQEGGLTEEEFAQAKKLLLRDCRPTDGTTTADEEALAVAPVAVARLLPDHEDDGGMEDYGTEKSLLGIV